MKKLLLATMVLCMEAKAQNVGIGTSTPSSKLTVSGSESTIAGVDAGIQVTNTAPGGGTWYLRAGATGTETPAGGFSLTNSSFYRFSMDNTGRLGLGISNPTEKLHLATGNIRLSQSDKGIILNSADRAMITRGFDPFTSGVHSGLGRWGLFMEPNNLTLGIPNVFGKEVEVAKFNEDGSKIPVFSVSSEGLIKVFDNAGMQGQVLTSNGSNAASWQNAALTSSTRFSADFSSSSASGYVTFNTNPRYNLDPANISVASSGITLAKAGLYHFECIMASSVSYPSANPPQSIPIAFAELNIGQATNYTLYSDYMHGNVNTPGTANFIFRYSEKISFEVYISAGALVRINSSLLTSLAANSYSTAGHLTAHLIAP